ncbi:glycerophosphodiester phosphodiesterase [Vibrio splendidus]|uniref:glycerophosphodiester phosphodiesterase n=1 Tax=Vibrio splendidus TaxID=29497 RepID=UPI000066F9EB|nr:glycerophosphodiester phosphodiesterase [Vibrio splendidus]EAP96470.1 glycerophosphoryl diester phosphodiesterase [Vibrio splendidus 12B01]
MKTTSLSLTLLAFSLSANAFADPLVIAHRGASGYLPEHTLPAKALAYAMKPDYIEQDVVMTKDDQLVVLHDHYLDRVTDVADRFPDRARADGRYYAIDFTLAEIKSLKVTEGFNLDEQGKRVAGYPTRFPMWQSDFRVATFAEEIELIQGLNKTLGYDVGIYPEIKAPWFHRHEGKDISKAVLATLQQYGYLSKDDKVYLQCFDANELQRINDELMPAMEMDLKLVQLMAYTDWNETMTYKGDKATPYSYDWMFEKGGMAKVASYADGIGPWKPMLVDDASTKDNIIIKPLMKSAKDVGLDVHPYTFRADPGRIPAYADNFDGMLDVFYNQVKVDGVFTDFPDKAVDFLKR